MSSFSRWQFLLESVLCLQVRFGLSSSGCSSDADMVFVDPYREKAQRIKGVFGTKSYKVRNYYAFLGVAYSVGCGWLFWRYLHTPRMKEKMDRITKSDSFFGLSPQMQPGDFTIEPKLRHMQEAEAIKKLEAEKEKHAVQAETARKSGVEVKAEPEMTFSAKLAQAAQAAQSLLRTAGAER